MEEKCPGRLTPRELDSVLVPCPDCGRLVEFFTDEPKRQCRCGRVLLRESLPRCAEWCPAAAQCLGEAIDIRELERRLAKVRDDPRARQCLESIRERLKKRRTRVNDQGPRRIGGFKLPPPQDLREVVSRAFEAVRGQGLDQLEWLGASRSGGAWRLPVLNDAFEVDLSASRVRTRAGAEVGILWKSLSLHYLAVRDRPEPRPPELVLADLPEGRTYAEVYRRRVVERLCSTAGRDAATLLAAGTALGGRPADAGDLAFDFSVFPRVQLRLIWHAADEEFPPSATVLLPANVGSFFCVEDIVIVSEQLVARLAGRTF